MRAWKVPLTAAQRHADMVRRLREAGGVTARDTGEVLTFPDTATRQMMGWKYQLDHPDWETRRKGIERFKRSSDYKRFSPFRNRFI